MVDCKTNMREYTRSIITIFTTKEFIRFFIIGVSTFIVDFGILTFLIYTVDFNPTWLGIFSGANVISTFIAITLSYTFNRFWSFGATEQSVIYQGGKYIAVFSITYLLNNLIFGGFIIVGVSPEIAKLFVTFLQMIWSYFMYKYIVFTKQPN